MGLRATIYARSKYKPFVSTWKTDNTSTGSSTSTQVTLPLNSGGSYSFIVDWGDGSSNAVNTYNVGNTHTYAVAGTYTVTIKGKCNGWYFNNTGDRLKLLTIEKWGSFKTQNFTNVFVGCANLNLSAVQDVLDLRGVNSLGRFFSDCTTLTTINRIGEWDVSAIVSFNGMFSGASSFNQNLNSWNMVSATNCGTMFKSFATMLFNNGLASGVSGALTWNIPSLNVMEGMFYGCAHFNQTVSGFNTTNVSSIHETFRACVKFNQDIGGWNTINVTDASSFLYNANLFNNGGSSSIGSWNTSKLVDASLMFAATSLNHNLNSWDVSKVTNFTNMLSSTPFNNGLASGVSGTLSWTINTIASSVNMANMFSACTAFNQIVSGWNTSKVTNTSSMFLNCTNFNNGLASGVAGNMLWDLSSVTTTASMFNGCGAFNQNLGALNLSNCTTFASMFQSASKYNNGGSTDINSWILKTTGTVSLQNTFFGATIFNQNIGGWNTIAVNILAATFSSTTFNNGGSDSIKSWNTSNVTNMVQTFQANTSFNQPLLWDVSKVTSFQFCFYGTIFNQDISSWTPVLATNMNNMFGASQFNQNIGSWNISLVTDFNGFMIGKTPATFSTANLDAIYSDTTGWASRPVKTPITITFGTAKYTAAGSAGKAILQGAPNNWSITDGGI